MKIAEREMEELSMKKRVGLLVMLLALTVMGFAMNVEAAEIIYRGYCGGEGDGKNLTWTLDRDGVLVIEGQGKMKDSTYEEVSYEPTDWNKYRSDIYSVIIRNGVMSIGGQAFRSCSHIKSVILPKTLTSIGNEAFEYCDKLSSIDLPESLTSIGNEAFNECTSLKNIVLPESLTNIGYGIFSNCWGLSNIVLPYTLTRIEDSMFVDCSNLKKINLPKSLTYIGDDAFSWCYSLEHIVIPNSVTSICKNAFAFCNSLSSIYIPSSVVTIERSAFRYTYLTDVYYGGTKEQWDKINIVSDDNMDIDDHDGLLNAIIHYADDNYKQLEDFVSWLYRNFLKREPDEKGLTEWVDVLRFGRGTGAKVVAGFVLSPEYKANSLSNKDYVTALYRIIFNREPDTAGLNAWIGVMENGCTNKKVLSGFVNSEEFKNLCRDLGIVSGTYTSDEITDQNVKIAAFVARLYNICLERAYEQEGLNYWVNALVDRTMTGSSVAQGFFGSQEFKNRKLDNTEFVTTAYRAILNREPDPTGLKSWVDALERGKTREFVLNGFLKSAEFDNLCKEYRIASGNARIASDLGDILYDLDIMGFGGSNDLEGLSDRELKLARNEIYARKGYIFNDPEMAEYFGKKEWYRPSVPAKDFDENVFSEYEYYKLQEILSEEERRSNERATLGKTDKLVAEIERFLNSTPANGFLRSTFSEPGPDVDLGHIIYQLGSIGVDTKTVVREMEKEGDSPFADVSNINSDKLDELLYRLTGYGLYDKKWNVSDLPYLKSIDTYYIDHGDTNYWGCWVKEVKSLGNDIYEVIITRGLIIRLKRIETGGYQFISILPYVYST